MDISLATANGPPFVVTLPKFELVGSKFTAVVPGIIVWFQAESRRRPQFKQTLQDTEHQGFTEHRARLEKEIREILAGNKYGIQPGDVIRDLFSTMSPPLKGYRRMAWVVGNLDDAHWDPTPETAREPNFAKYFRQENPGSAIRVLLIAAPVTHYAHIERPQQLGAALIGAVHWVMQ